MESLQRNHGEIREDEEDKVKDRLIKDIEIKLSMQGYSREESDKIIHCVISCLDNYEVTKASTELSLRYEALNEDIMKRYVVCLQIDGKSKGTIRVYLWTLRKLSEQMRKPFPEMTATDIRRYLGDLKVKGNKNQYIKNQRAYIAAFTKWMVAEEITVKDPCAKVNDIKTEQEVRLPFTSVDIDRLRSSVTGVNALRDRAVMETLLSSGVRCAELCDLTRDDIDIRNRTLYVRCGKGGKGRTVFVSEIAAEHISKYLSTRKDDKAQLFIGKRGTMSTNGIMKMLKKYGKIAQVDNVHPHRFRRTFATTMYRRGMDLEEIRRLMGHTVVQTTLRYIYADETQLRAAYNKYVA